MLFLLYLEESSYTRTIISAARGDQKDLESITNAEVQALLKRYGKKMVYEQVTKKEIAMYVANSYKQVDIESYPVLIHIDAKDNRHTYHISDMFDDEFMVGATLEDEMH